MNWEQFESKLRAMGGIVEEFIPGGAKKVAVGAVPRSTRSAPARRSRRTTRCWAAPTGRVFPGLPLSADAAYRLAIQERAWARGEAFAAKGVLGRFAVDFVSVATGTSWRHYAIEINLRKGGTTHPFLMLQFLTDGATIPPRASS